MDTCSPDKSRTASAILAYLQGHDDAQGTIENIAAWWLRERKSALPPTFLKEVLSDLVTQGLVERREEKGTVRYRSHPRK